MFVVVLGRDTVRQINRSLRTQGGIGTSARPPCGRPRPTRHVAVSQVPFARSTIVPRSEPRLPPAVEATEGLTPAATS